MNNFSTIKYADDIYGFENFLTETECKSILNILKEEEELGLHKWVPISFYESFTIGYPHEGHELFSKYNLPGDFFKQLQDGFKDRVSFVSGVDINSVSNIGLHLQRWDKGAYAHYHSDNSDNDGNCDWNNILNNVDFKKLRGVYIDMYCDLFSEWLKENYNLVIQFKNISLSSPREYNFKTDEIVCDITPIENESLIKTMKLSSDKSFLQLFTNFVTIIVLSIV